MKFFVIFLSLLAGGLWSSSVSWSADEETQQEEAAASDEVRAMLDRVGELIHKKKYDEALRIIDKYLERHPKDALVLVWRSSVYVSQGNLEKAMKDAEEAVCLAPRKTWGHLARCGILMRQGEMEKALRAALEAYRINPREVRVLCDCAYLYSFKNQFDEALEMLDEAALIEPENAEIYWYRGYVWERQDQTQKALEDYRHALKINPASIPTLTARGYLYLYKKKYDKAWKDFQAARAMDPTNDEALSGIATIQGKRGEYPKALATFEMALRHNPQSTYVLSSYAWFLATVPEESIRDGKRALELAKKACKISHYQDHSDLVALAAAYAAVGDFDSAVKWQKKVLQAPIAPMYVDKMKKCLESYRAKKPYLDTDE
jgi:tetratricopeptide (TPR) repeat protein